MASDRRQPPAGKRKVNCWEALMCGREPGGSNVDEFGACPAASDRSFDGINRGRCGGRICWAVAGTFCGGCTQGEFDEKRASCLTCDFYQMVQEEEGLAGRQVRFLQYINKDAHSPFFDRMTYRHVKSGERFVTQGAIEDNAYIIQRGSCLVIVEKDGKLHPVDHYGEGDIVGGLGILTGEPRRAHVEAETDMDLWVMTRDQFEDMAEKDEDLLSFITELVADRLDSRRPTAYRTIGKYLATDIIGRGAFSIVYRGEHKSLGRPVVIKMMRHHLTQYPDFLNNFRNEARIIARLNHPHIVNVYDYDERYRTLFIIMEYVRGDSLKDMIRRLRTLPPALTVKFLIQICSALDYAHRQGIVHRDINPSNIIIQPDDRIKILDFGLACPAGTEDLSDDGTAHYMAPEQVAFERVDQRTDIYALGITAYEMVTGECPYPGDDLKALKDAHLTREIPDPAEIVPDVPEALRSFILKSTQRDPEKRYRDVREAMNSLEPMINSESGAGDSEGRDRRKMSTLFLAYPEDRQQELNRLIEEFSARVGRLGGNVRHADLKDL